jgi:hypothetical protein
MKFPKEYVFIFILGLFVLAYLLDAVVNPLAANLPTPYHFFTPTMLAQVPFTTTSVFIKGLGVFLIPILLTSFVKNQFTKKAVVIFVIASLLQLYALQDIVTNSAIIPVEWALALTFAGMALTLLSGYFLIKGMFFSLQKNVSDAKMESVIQEVQEEDQD